MEYASGSSAPPCVRAPEGTKCRSRNAVASSSCPAPGRARAEHPARRPAPGPLPCNFPIIPQAIFEQVVGFFDRIAALHNSEASVLLAWDRDEECVRVVVPEQTATVTRYYDGYQHAIGLFYHPPTDLPSSWVVFGDIHSHVNMSAYSSVTDVKDEAYSAGLHLVVGRIYRQDPEFHVEVVVDGQRFELELHEVVEGYEERNSDIPEEWIGRVTIEASAPWWKGSDGDTGSSWSGKSGSCGTSAYESGQDQ